ncbi:Phage-related baseplate assembly protein [Andreprevotia lacus DSM 23236]|jgi:phage-related baseplate assembly protein|uniref:Phage-related baseplate assembly protein n=1 Tax=Andreprevotia lacus DSM 23236 TaxID=1121001 RepID=A0A1W1XJW1_9NEIS|nr:baseplate J/gp47 family protein [Andreprevotia lacus]SMC24235.1 Phage-related baseplate assembly protein [Andreprevotia lacus DSM 23236]
MSDLFNFSRLPPPDVVEEIRYEVIYADLKALFLSLVPAEQRTEVARTLELETEPVAILLQVSAYQEMIWRQRVNEAARAVMLAQAYGADLDQLAANNKTQRLVVTPADPSTVPPTPAVMESDESLRVRAQEAFERLSVAGPRAAYAGYARAADGRISDVSVVSPNPCEVVVTVLSLQGNGSAPADLLANVSAALSAEDVRPISDLVTVQSAVIVDYSIAVRLWLFPGPESEPILAAVRQRLAAYADEQRRLGRDIRRSAITGVAYVPGVQRIEVDSPAADLVISPVQSSRCTSMAVTLAGTDE